MVRHIELDAPNVSELEKQHLCRCIDSGFVSTFGPFISEFEQRFVEYLGVKKAVSTQSGTAAIHIALYELGIGARDEVIVPALTFIATINPILYVGAKPVIVDVDVDTWTIKPKAIEEAITPRTKAVIPVHLYGNPCQMDKIVQVAREADIYVIEDATESLGSKYAGKYTGTLGDLGCFSFNGNKTITTGGGGMVVGNDEEKLDYIRFLVNQARDESRGYYHPTVGFNYRMTNIEAAFGLAQMERLEEFLRKKKEFNAIYKEELKEIPFIHFQKEYEGAENSCWLSCAVFEKDADVAVLQRKLKEQGIPTRRLFVPLAEFPPYRGYQQTDCRNSYHIYQRGLCLPSSTVNSNDDVYYVCESIKKFL